MKDDLHHSDTAICLFVYCKTLQQSTTQPRLQPIPSYTILRLSQVQRICRRKTEMWLLKDFKIPTAWKTLWKKVKLLKMSNFTFFTMFSKKLYTSMC